MDTILQDSDSYSLKELIRYYFCLKPKLKYREIVRIINEQHNRPLTFRILKRICNSEGLNRKRNITQNELYEAIENELCTSASLIGYRQMTEIVSYKYNVNIAKEDVRLALRILDPQGVSNRRKKCISHRFYHTNGPGHVYHIDGNDKLKKWGICIHGAVDGFSRKKLWLAASITNNDPMFIVNLYLLCIKKHRIVPRLLRMDNGTENIYCKGLQTFLTKDNNSYISSVSIRNQRIESFWSRLKKFKTNWWIDFFTMMEKDGLYNGNLETHKELLLFSFLPVVQSELNHMVETWNRRQVRQSAVGPAGKPDMLFYFPGSFGYDHQGIGVNTDDLVVAEDMLGIDSFPICRNKDLFELFDCYVHLHNLVVGSNADDALNLYISLLGYLHDDNLIF
jgi:hypothetical protein